MAADTRTPPTPAFKLLIACSSKASVKHLLTDRSVDCWRDQVTKVKLEQKQKEGIAEARSGRRGPVSQANKCVRGSS